MRSALVGASADAQLVVVGARDRDGLANRLQAAVGHTVMHGAHCLVAVVHREEE
jgi:nucleotide-binding universal stress UspA family protein